MLGLENHWGLTADISKPWDELSFKVEAYMYHGRPWEAIQTHLLVFCRLELCGLSTLTGLTAYDCELFSRPEELCALAQLQSLALGERGQEGDLDDPEPNLYTSEADLEHLSGTHLPTSAQIGKTKPAVLFQHAELGVTRPD